MPWNKSLSDMKIVMRYHGYQYSSKIIITRPAVIKAPDDEPIVVEPKETKKKLNGSGVCSRTFSKVPQ